MCPQLTLFITGNKHLVCVLIFRYYLETFMIKRYLVYNFKIFGEIRHNIILKFYGNLTWYEKAMPL